MTDALRDPYLHGVITGVLATLVVGGLAVVLGALAGWLEDRRQP